MKTHHLIYGLLGLLLCFSCGDDDSDNENTRGETPVVADIAEFETDSLVIGYVDNVIKTADRIVDNQTAYDYAIKNESLTEEEKELWAEAAGFTDFKSYETVVLNQQETRTRIEEKYGLRNQKLVSARDLWVRAFVKRIEKYKATIYTINRVKSIGDCWDLYLNNNADCIHCKKASEEYYLEMDKKWLEQFVGDDGECNATCGYIFNNLVDEHIDFFDCCISNFCDCRVDDTGDYDDKCGDRFRF